MKVQSALGLITALLVLIVSSAVAAPRIVDCDKGDSLQKALDAGGGSDRLVDIYVTGTCYEDLRVVRNRVRIVGDELATIDGQVRAFSVDNLTMSDLIVTGGIAVWGTRTRFFDLQIIDNSGSGIFASDNSSVNCVRCAITGNREGIRLNSSRARLTDSNVDFNNSAGEFSDGILVLQNSNLTTEGGSISGNGNLGIRVNWNSSIFVMGTRIESNGAYALQMFNASSGDLSNAHVVDNAGFGIELGGNSALEMYGGEVRGNGWNGVRVSEHSMLRLHGTTITGNGGHGIDISRDGGVVANGETLVSGNGQYFQVKCFGDEASIEVADESTVEPLDCSGF